MFNTRSSLRAPIHNKRKRRDRDSSFEKGMPPFFQSLSAKTLQPPPAPCRKPSERLQRPSNDLDDFISSDLENSFASSMSLNSPPGSPRRDTFAPSGFSEAQSPMAMDISPAPHQKADDTSEGKSGRRCLTSARSFGRELGNHLSGASKVENASVRPTGKGPQRAPLPSEWLANMMPSKAPEVTHDDHGDAGFSDAMDVDDCILPESLTRPTIDEPTLKFAPTQETKGFSSLFFDGMSSPPPILPKRRSLSPEGSRLDGSLRQRYSNDEGAFLQVPDQESSSPAPSSPSVRTFERVKSSGSLFGKTKAPAFLTALAGGGSISDGPKKPKRPALVPSEAHTQSAFSVLQPSANEGFMKMPAPRRAFSTTVPTMPSSPGEDESEAGPELSSPAAHAFAKKQTARTIRRRDGTDDFRPFAAGGLLRQRDTTPTVQSPLRNATPTVMNESPSARWLKGTGLPGFGDNEAHGKVLPCEKVAEDGLMRIDVQTLDALMSGAYSDKIISYQIIDCRFDYEYQGGHIKGAVNINTTAEIEEFLLSNSASKPAPSCSGDSNKKVVLVFHCEFSAKRAPTFAKHLRAKDRAMNNHVYPRIHYPEVYILKGGYYQYFTESAMYCDPHGYIPMDDPQFARDRRQDLDQFRTKSRFGRTRSYAYGEAFKAATGQSSHQAPNPFSHHQRNSAPNAPSLMAAASISRARRSGDDAAPSYLSTLEEDSMVGMTSVSSDESGILEGVDKSPCPPPAARVNKNLFGMSVLNSKRNNANAGHGPLQRAQTVAQIR
ncbi:MIH1 [Sanghuangporus vaninii]